jgi:tetratricopeptide (TPR) repeat protein
LLPVAVALLAYGGSLGGDYVHDDHAAIAQNAALQGGDWLGAAFGGDHSPLSGRPVACASFTLSGWLGVTSPPGHRVVNLLLHSLNAVLLAAVVRRTLLAANLAGVGGERRATWIATVLAMLFAGHPLTVDAVAYLTQRSMLLMATALLTALLATLRAGTSPRPGLWRAVAIAAVVSGMGCKEEFVAAPLLVVLFERAYLVPSFAALRSRWRFHAGLAAGWLVLLACVLLAPPNRTVGYDALVVASPFEWLLTEAPVVVHYARLSLWPSPLLPVYDWPIVRSVGDSLLPGALVLLGIAATIWLWRRRPAWGWLGALFFLLLAPTSSVLPIVTEPVAERRVYLPMVALLVPAVLGVARLITWQCRTQRSRAVAAIALTGGALLLAIPATRAHAAVYQNDAVLWAYSYEHNELTNRSLVSGIILANQAVLLRHLGRVAESHQLYDRAAQSPTLLSASAVGHANSLLERGREDEAVQRLRSLLRERGDHRQASLLLALFAAPGAAPRADAPQRLAEAEQLLGDLVQQQPGDAEAHNLLGMILAQQTRPREAEMAFRRAVELAPDQTLFADNLLLLLRRERGAAEALAFWRPLADRRPDDVDAQKQLAQLCLETGDRDGAQAALQNVLRRQPGDAATRALLDQLTRTR